MRYKTIREQFKVVDKRLWDIGVKRINLDYENEEMCFIFDHINKRFNGLTPLIRASIAGDLMEVQNLLNQYASVKVLDNRHNRSALHMAAEASS